GIVVRRHRAPAEDFLPFLRDDAAENLFALGALLLVVRHEDHAHAVFAGGGEFYFCFLGDELQEFVRRLHDDARAVAGVDLAAARAAVIEVEQNLDRLPDDVVGLPALRVDDEADAAGLVLELRIVQTLLRGCGPATTSAFRRLPSA